MAVLLDRLLFGAGGNGIAALGSGWSAPEAEWTWSDGVEAILTLPIPAGPGDLHVELTAIMYAGGDPAQPQQIELHVGGRCVVRQLALLKTVLAFRLGRTDMADPAELHIRLHLPDAKSPAAMGLGDDRRRLAIGLQDILLLDVPAQMNFTPHVRRSLIDPASGLINDGHITSVTGLPIPTLVGVFESLGTTCEFGLFQRLCHVETLGLLRFAGLALPRLLEGLDDGFSKLDDPAGLTAQIEGSTPEWVVTHEGYGMRYHTFRSPGDISRESLLVQQATILQYRRDKLLEILGTGEKLFVVNRPRYLSAAEALPLLAVLESYGPNALLFVSTDTGQPPGTVEILRSNFYRGALDGIEAVADDAELIGRDTWLSDRAAAAWASICANAYAAWQSVRVAT